MANRKLSRRDVLRGAAAGSAGLLIGGQGLPAFGQEKAPELDLPQGAAGKLTVIHRTEYFEAAQTAFRDTVTKFAAANNAELDISTTNPESFGDFMGKMSAAVRAGNPPDFAYTSNVSIPQMHLLDLVEDVTDVVDEAVSKYGNIMPGLNAAKTGQFDGRWKAVPFIGTTTGYYIRGDKLKELGIDPASLKTFSDRREAALKMSSPGFYGWGVTPNQSGDGFGYLTLAIQAFGGHFTDQTGQIGYTHNAFSVYAQAKRDKNPVYDNIVLLPAPRANNGDSRDGGIVGGWLTIFKGSKNVDLAKKLALDLLDPANFGPMAELGGVLFTPAYANLWTDKLLASDPNLAIIKQQVSVEKPFLGQSWPANPNAGVDSIRAQGVVEQMVANAISGRMAPADAVKDAHQKMVDIFEEGGMMQP
jgi:multiple sugar transport system substrate-binding protein